MAGTKALTDGPGVETSSRTSQMIAAGAGRPETVVTAPVKALYMRNDGGAGTCLYVEESGSGNTNVRIQADVGQAVSIGLSQRVLCSSHATPPPKGVKAASISSRSNRMNRLPMR
jgi:hypothetical protein